MARDIREEILVRVEAILTALADGTGTYVWRDRDALDDSETVPGSGVYKEIPAYVLLDGIETKGTGSSDRRGDQIMLLQPEIYYIPVPPPNALNEDMGPRLSQFRIKILRAVMGDGVLQDLVGDNGYIEYRGMLTDMQAAGEVKGQFKMDFAFAYVLNFNKI